MEWLTSEGSVEVKPKGCDGEMERDLHEGNRSENMKFLFQKFISVDKEVEYSGR